MYSGDEDKHPPISRIRSSSETPLRRRARRRTEHRPLISSGFSSVLPPFWVILASAIVPVLFVAGIFAIQQLQHQSADMAISAPGQFVVTATISPTSIVPELFYQWLTATPAPVPTATPTVITDFSGFASATPSFSLYNSIIVFACYVNESDEICLMRADGSDMRQLTSTPGTDWYPSFSPDGNTIVFSSQGSGDFEVMAMDLNGQNMRQLTSSMGDNYAPAISPDGSRIVFASTFGGGQNIWVINIDGSNPIRLTRDSRDDIDPVWSPDGMQISFTSSRNGAGTLMIMNADGSNLRPVTHGINVEGRNDWSPDGRLLAFYAGPAGDKNIYLIDATCADMQGGCGPDQVRQLTTGGNNKGPGFSPDGQWITFASQLDGDNEIFVTRIDGSESYQLTSNRRADWQPRWGWYP